MSSTAEQAAYKIIHGFDKSFRWFSRVTGNAQSLFEQGDWKAMQAHVKQRITIYEQSLTDVVIALLSVEPKFRSEAEFWRLLKQAYTQHLEQHPQQELAQTYYNSVVSRIFKHTKFSDDYLFLTSTEAGLNHCDYDRIAYSFRTDTTVKEMYESLFSHYKFSIPYEDRDRDIRRLDRALRRRLNKAQLASVTDVTVLKSVFFRGKSAYIIGKIETIDTVLPFVVALQTNEEHQLYVDALLTDRRDLSAVFGFTRAYFMVDVSYPAQMVSFLSELLPHKKPYDLYVSLGFHKHGKTEFYRDFLQHLETSEDQFVVAPGIKGLVMAVFTLPTYGVVFKVIRDQFAESKNITREHVKRCYQKVKLGDRVGRMADTQEYVNFQLPVERISAELMEELQTTCNSSIEITDQILTIKHLYIEKKLTPLNLFLAGESDESKVDQAIKDLGYCIKQIAMADIFPGDMLHKNFGISKQGRVIFYDYDEITAMNERTFRMLPKDDPYALDNLSVGATDVFPEQFEYFILPKPAWKNKLKEFHGELFTAQYWQQLQNDISAGLNPHFCPYNPAIQFPRESQSSK